MSIGFHADREKAVDFVLDSMCHMAFDYMWMTAYKCLPLPRVVTTALMRMPRVREECRIPDGFSYKYFEGYKGQPWNIIYCKCGALMWRYIKEGDPRLRTATIGKWDLLIKMPNPFSLFEED